MMIKNFGFDAEPGKVLFETGLYSPASLQTWFELAKSFRDDLEFVLTTGDETVSLILEKDPNAKNIREKDNVPCVISSITSNKTNESMDHETMRQVSYNHVADIFANPFVRLECRDGIDGMFTRDGCHVSVPKNSPDNFLIGIGQEIFKYLRDETPDQKRHFSSEIWRSDQIDKFLPIFESYPEGTYGMDLETHAGTTDQKTLSLLVETSKGAMGRNNLNIVGVKYPNFIRSDENGRDAFSKAYHSLQSLFTRKNTQGTPVVVRGYSHVEDKHDINDFKSLSCPLVPNYKLAFKEFLMEYERKKDDAKRLLYVGRVRK